MNKTNPIGVRFRADLLEKLKNDHGIESPQKALVFYERFFVTHSGYVRDVKAPLRDDLDLTPAAKKEVKNIKIKDLPKTEGVLKPQEQPKTNFSINAKPKTLDELKTLCPANLTGLDRSEWIRTERQKYGI